VWVWYRDWAIKESISPGLKVEVDDA